MLSQLVYSGMLKRVSLPNLRYISSTGDVLSVPLIDSIQTILPQVKVVPMYGQTECKRIAVMPLGMTGKIMNGSCGLPLTGTHAYIRDPDENGIGELIVSGPHVMFGYLHSDEESAGYFFYDKNWGHSLRTGDLFHIDEDGYLYYHDRIKRIVKHNGYRIGLKELENTYEEKLKGLYQEIRLLGVPDPLCGEQILVCVVSTINSDVLVMKLQETSITLAEYQRPAKAYITQEPFPLNPNGKIDDERLLKDAEKTRLYSL
jgi:acyl-CoA synthetase (AMP-forming)/AMP-acid ligase II